MGREVVELHNDAYKPSFARSKLFDRGTLALKNSFRETLGA